MMICGVRPSSSISATPRTTHLPRPVRYASRTPALPMMIPPVGKSGPGMICIRSCVDVPGSSMIRQVASQTSRRLWGGMFVAIPTAIPLDPFTRRFGTLAGRTSGSWSDSSKFGTKSTVSLLMSVRSSSEIFVSLASVYRIAAAESPSIDPKFPWPSTSV